ncbi:MAG: Integral rane protein TerC [Pedosphaera sp.]|nr:Integral rane protein TerC [Pedosphaera sp.]
MLALVEITAWHWVAFIACILVFLALDLGLFHRKAHVVKFKEALCWTLVWVVVAILFALLLGWFRGKHDALAFTTGYFIELSLSIDNVFVIALIFARFRVPSEFQHRVLFWGILGALIMRGLMIWAGIQLINRFDWVLYGLGLLLLFAGIKMLFSKGESDPEKSRVLIIARKFLPVSKEFDGQKFITLVNGRKFLTPLFLVLLMVETTDLIFAVDSIPAIFGVTRNPFIVFTSNVFAILGLRSMYFVLAGAIGLFKYLNVGLSVILIFIGTKMLIDPHDNPPRWFQYDIPDSASLLTVVTIIAIAVLASLVSARREKAHAAIAQGKPGKLP